MSRLPAPSLDAGALDGLIARLLAGRQVAGGRALRPVPGDAWWRNREIAAAAGGLLDVDGRQVPIRVGLPMRFPLCLPAIAVEPTDETRTLPHVDDDGHLCYEDETSLLLDRRDPWGLLEGAIERARDVLRSIRAHDPGPEFAREIPAYWNRLARETIRSMVTPGEAPRRINAVLSQGRLFAVADRLEDVARCKPDRRSAGLTAKHAVYVPVPAASGKLDFRPRDLTTLAGLQSQIALLPLAEREKLRALVGGDGQRDRIIVLGIDRSPDERALVAVRLRRVRGGHALLDASASADVIPVKLERWDRAFLGARGGAKELFSKRVLLVGCGAVGGYVALQLARAGVGHLTVVDPDEFKPENIHRHACAMSRVNQRKALGLKAELERQVPYVQVDAMPVRIESFLAKRSAGLDSFDLVVSAMGNPTVELWLNEVVWNEAHHPPALFTWLEPLGLGGHALATHLAPPARASGCFECLFVRRDSLDPLENRAAFAAPGGAYTRQTLGCGSQFVAFGDQDAVRTAAMAVRLGVSILAGRVAGAALASWRSDGDDFRAGGFATTARFERSPTEGMVGPSVIRRESCLLCSGTTR